MLLHHPVELWKDSVVKFTSHIYITSDSSFTVINDKEKQQIFDTFG